MQEWKGGGRAGSQIITRSPKSGNQKMANIGKVKFQPPNVPVIFVLGKRPAPPGFGSLSNVSPNSQADLDRVRSRIAIR